MYNIRSLDNGRLGSHLALYFDLWPSTRGFFYFGSWFAVRLILPAHAVAQAPSVPLDSSSCRRFVQQFYDWYVPLTQTTMNGPASDSALQHKAEVFNPDLLRALKVDSEASAHAKGEIVGLDAEALGVGEYRRELGRVQKLAVNGATD